MAPKPWAMWGTPCYPRLFILSLSAQRAGENISALGVSRGASKRAGDTRHGTQGPGEEATAPLSLGLQGKIPMLVWSVACVPCSSWTPTVVWAHGRHGGQVSHTVCTPRIQFPLFGDFLLAGVGNRSFTLFGHDTGGQGTPMLPGPHTTIFTPLGSHPHRAGLREDP